MSKPIPVKPAISELRRGFELAIKNAIKFNQDANYLIEGDRISSATLLAIYSLDELGKAMTIAKAAIHPDQSDSAWIDHMKKFTNHKPKIEFVLELFWMFESAFLLGHDRFRQLIEEETKKVLMLRAEIAFVDLKDGVFSIPMEVERDRCIKLFSVLDQFFSTLDSILPRLREMLQEKESLKIDDEPLVDNL
jgi:AbiV family abortive infection protein